MIAKIDLMMVVIRRWRWMIAVDSVVRCSNITIGSIPIGVVCGLGVFADSTVFVWSRFEFSAPTDSSFWALIDGLSDGFECFARLVVLIDSLNWQPWSPWFALSWCLLSFSRQNAGYWSPHVHRLISCEPLFWWPKLDICFRSPVAWGRFPLPTPFP